MRNRLAGFAAVLVLGLAATAGAQGVSGGGLVAQQTQRFDACKTQNAQAAAGSQTTLTIAAPATSGQSVYVYEVDVQYCVGTALGAVVNPTNTTTTNLGGLQWAITLPTTANTCYNSVYTYPTGAKAAAASASVTIVGIAGTANLTQNINACFNYAP